LYRVIEVSPNAVAIADAEANIEYVNQRFSQLTGYSFEEVVGKPVIVLASRERERKIATCSGPRSSPVANGKENAKAQERTVGRIGRPGLSRSSEMTMA